MRVIRKEEISNAIKNPNGEEIYEMIGRSPAIGGTTHHSLVHVVIPPGKSSHAHFHEVSEETYYILKGVGLMRIGEENTFRLHPGQACLIHPHESHQIFNEGAGDLEFLTVSAPAWTPDDSFFIPEQQQTFTEDQQPT
jgi:mannose-6-phosphate isomerase-like protein (cupin superfamily)